MRFPSHSGTYSNNVTWLIIFINNQCNALHITGACRDEKIVWIDLSAVSDPHGKIFIP